MFPVAVNPVLQLSVTLAAPNAALIWAGVGLHPRAVAAANVITGAVVSLRKVIVWLSVAVLAQLSVTVHVLITERVQPLPVSDATVPVATRPALQLSVTVAAPKAALISACVGLHGKTVAGASVITGLVVSLEKV